MLLYTLQRSLIRILQSPFYRLGNWGPEWSDLLKVIKLGTEIWTSCKLSFKNCSLAVWLSERSGYPKLAIEIEFLISSVWVLRSDRMEVKIQEKPWRAWLSGLSVGTVNQKVAGLISSKGTCLGCRPAPWLGAC